MQICYVDEAGCTGLLPTATSDIQPLLVVGAIFINHSEIAELTTRFLDLKQHYFPLQMPSGGRPLDRVLVEIKGADLRRDVRSGHRAARRRVIGFLDDVCDLFDQLQVRFVARVWIKDIGGPFDGTAVYTSSIQSIGRSFQDYLTGLNDRGFMIADSRSKAGNVNLAHSMFTQKFQQAGDTFNRVLEMPTFGNSDNHVGLQISDLLCSSLLFPIGAYSYCLGHVNNVHVHSNYEQLKRRFGPRLLPLQHRYQDQHSVWRGGVTVSDPIGHRNGALMFH